MRSAIATAAAAHRRAGRQRSTSLSAIPPDRSSEDYLPELAAIAASILYRSPSPSNTGRPVYILNAAAFPDAFEVDYDSLLSYVLARLPDEDELLAGTEYEIIFFAGGQPDSATAEKKQGPGMGWYIQAYHILSRATRKKLQRLYIVHPRTWVRVLISVFGTIVSPKFRRKIVHVNTLSALALQIPIDTLLIPPPVYLHDRKLSPEIDVPYVSGRRAFGAKHLLPKDLETGETRLPRVLRETTAFVLMPTNIVTEGLFRIPPHSTLSGVLKECYDRGQQFIVWKEKDATVVQPGADQTLIDEVRLEDSYGVHLAASLMKQWYRELREPIVPESSYDALRERFGPDPETVIGPEDLVDLFLPQSETSPLSPTGREIATRHLLPMLSEVANHEPQNRMGAEGLSICWSMNVLNGTDQLEDAKISSLVKRILQAAIVMWPQLREGMGLPADTLYKDLEGPADFRYYEDPLEEVRSKPDRDYGDEESHRILLDLSDEGPPSDESSSRPSSSHAHEKAPALPPRPGAQGKATSPAPPVKRKPVVQPSGHSAVFDVDGRSPVVETSPSSYTAPANGLGPPQHGDRSYGESEKALRVQLAPDRNSDPTPSLKMPKRKAVSTEHEPSKPRLSSPPSAESMTGRSASDSTAAPAPAIANLTHQLNTAFSARPPPTLISPTATSESPTVLEPLPNSIDPTGFRKPSLPASATRTQPRQNQTYPRPTTTSATPGSSQTAPPISLTAPQLPKPRTPSPGLLKRMSTMELSTTSGPFLAPSAAADGGASASGSVEAGSALAPTARRATMGGQPQKLNLKKASVDDLRRLYEERGKTVEGLARGREGSGAGQ